MMPVRRDDLSADALDLVDRGIMPKPSARLCGDHKQDHDDEQRLGDVMGTGRHDGKSSPFAV
jgi:hypothetical protein